MGERLDIASAVPADVAERQSDFAMNALANDPNLDPSFRVALHTARCMDAILGLYAPPSAPAPKRTDAEKIKRLRAALSGLRELIESFDSVELTRDLPRHQAKAVYNAELQFAREVLEETA